MLSFGLDNDPRSFLLLVYCPVYAVSPDLRCFRCVNFALMLRKHTRLILSQFKNTVIWYNEEGTGRAAAPPSPLLAVPNAKAHTSTASVPTLYYSMWHYNFLCPLKG